MLKGGILLGAYDVRRPTRDVDAEAVSAEVSAEHVAQVVRDLSEVDADDGLLFDLGSLSVQEIREHDDYPGLRVRVKTWLGTQSCQISWDISTGDPIVPSPRRVRVPRVMGADIEMWGTHPRQSSPRRASRSSNEASPAPAGATTWTSCDWPTPRS